MLLKRKLPMVVGDLNCATRAVSAENKINCMNLCCSCGLGKLYGMYATYGPDPEDMAPPGSATLQQTVQDMIVSPARQSESLQQNLTANESGNLKSETTSRRLAGEPESATACLRIQVATHLCRRLRRPVLT